MWWRSLIKVRAVTCRAPRSDWCTNVLNYLFVITLGFFLQLIVWLTLASICTDKQDGYKVNDWYSCLVLRLHDGVYRRRLSQLLMTHQHYAFITINLAHQPKLPPQAGLIRFWQSQPSSNCLYWPDLFENPEMLWHLFWDCGKDKGLVGEKVNEISPNTFWYGSRVLS